MDKRRNLKKKNTQDILIYITSAIILLYIASIVFESNPGENQCQENQCEECKVVASCLEMEDIGNTTKISFILINQNTVQGSCSAKLSLIDTSKSIIKHVNFGDIQPGESSKREVFIEFLPEITNFSIDPFCDWNE